MTFGEYVRKVNKGKALPKRLLCIDPGKTTGWAIFNYGAYENAGHVPMADTDNLAVFLAKFVNKAEPTHVVIEDYRVQGGKEKAHIGKALFTPLLIGRFHQYLDMNEIPFTMQTSSQAKAFARNKMMLEMGLKLGGGLSRHAVDAIRHGVYYLLAAKR